MIWWDRSGAVQWLIPTHENEDSLPRHDWWTVTLPSWAGEYRAIGLAYEGHRVGAWWTETWCEGLHEVNAIETSHIASLIRWLKLPLLDEAIRPAINELVESAFGEFARMWIFDDHPMATHRYDHNNTTWCAAIGALYRLRPVTSANANQLVDLAWRARGREIATLVSSLDEVHPIFFIMVVRALMSEVAPNHRGDATGMLRSISESLRGRLPKDGLQDVPSFVIEEAKRLLEMTNDEADEYLTNIPSALENGPALSRHLACEFVQRLEQQIENL